MLAYQFDILGSSNCLFAGEKYRRTESRYYSDDPNVVEDVRPIWCWVHIPSPKVERLS